MITDLGQSTTATYIEILAREPRSKSYGADVLRQLCNLCYELPQHVSSHRQESAKKIVQALDAPFPFDSAPDIGAKAPSLPSGDRLFLWVELAFSEALPLWEFVDKASIYGILNRRLNSTIDENMKDDLALLYSILALGQRLEIGEQGVEGRRIQG